MVKSVVPAGLKSMKKSDVWLIGVLAALALASFGGLSLYSKLSTKEPEAVVYLEGKEQGRYALSEDTKVKISLENGNYNILKIQQGKADMVEASCPDKVCVNHRPVSMQGESLVCLPNQVVVEIENGEEGEVDASVN